MRCVASFILVFLVSLVYLDLSKKVYMCAYDDCIKSLWFFLLDWAHHICSYRTYCTFFHTLHHYLEYPSISSVCSLNAIAPCTRKVVPLMRDVAANKTARVVSGVQCHGMSWGQRLGQEVFETKIQWWAATSKQSGHNGRLTTWNRDFTENGNLSIGNVYFKDSTRRISSEFHPFTKDEEMNPKITYS